jgi:hypothetical protein
MRFTLDVWGISIRVLVIVAMDLLVSFIHQSSTSMEPVDGGNACGKACGKPRARGEIIR